MRKHQDRIAVAMVDDAERRGILKPGATIIEATSGNTGIALAFLAAARGYRLVLTMPERMSKERVALLRYLGANVELTPGTLMREARLRATALASEIPGAVRLEQFENTANPDEVLTVTEDEAFEHARRLAREEGILAGISSGASLAAALVVAKRPVMANKLVVTVIADTGERYINTPLISELALTPA